MKVLLIDDDRDLVDLVRYAFQRDGYTVVIAYDGVAGYQLFQAEAPDLVVLDMKMPRRSGMDVLQDIRRQSQVPVMILSSVGDESDVVAALDKGADDYVVKPFRPRELLARAAAAYRRSRSRMDGSARPMTPLACADLTLDPRRREVTVSGQPVHLTPMEFSLLHFLMLNHDIAISTSDIVANVWGYDADENDDVVKVTVSRLRRKLENDRSHPSSLVTVPGAGYMIKNGI